MPTSLYKSRSDSSGLRHLYVKTQLLLTMTTTQEAPHHSSCKLTLPLLWLFLFFPKKKQKNKMHMVVLPPIIYVLPPHTTNRPLFTVDSQGVEFTETSAAIGELCWPTCDGMTRRCKDFRATQSCANEGRMFGSLGILYEGKIR